MASEEPSERRVRRITVSKGNKWVTLGGVAASIVAIPTFVAQQKWMAAIWAFTAGLWAWQYYRNVNQGMEAVIDE